MANKETLWIGVAGTFLVLGVLAEIAFKGIAPIHRFVTIFTIGLAAILILFWIIKNSREAQE